MRKNILILVPVFLLFACSSGETKETGENADTAAQTRITDTAGKQNIDTVQAIEQPIELDDVPKTKEVNELLKYLVEKYKVNYKEIKSDELKVHVLDRFGCDKKYRIYLEKKIPVKYKEEDMMPVIATRAYVYKDSAQCANALNNWFNCFGNSCEMLQEQTEKVNSLPGYYILNPLSIICVEHQPEHDGDNWNKIHNDFKKLFVSKTSRVLQVNAKGEVKWVQL